LGRAAGRPADEGLGPGPDVSLMMANGPNVTRSSFVAGRFKRGAFPADVKLRPKDLRGRFAANLRHTANFIGTFLFSNNKMIYKLNKTKNERTVRQKLRIRLERRQLPTSDIHAEISIENTLIERVYAMNGCPY